MGSCFSQKNSSPSLETSRVSTQTPHMHEDVSLSLNPYVNKIHEITTQEDFDRLFNDRQNSNVLIVCDFYAMWCSPCLQIAPILHKWALNDYKNNVIFIKIDVDKNDDISNNFSIRFLPTFVLFREGKEISRVKGADLTKLRENIDKFK